MKPSFKQYFLYYLYDLCLEWKQVYHVKHQTDLLSTPTLLLAYFCCFLFTSGSMDSCKCWNVNDGHENNLNVHPPHGQILLNRWSKPPQDVGICLWKFPGSFVWITWRVSLLQGFPLYQQCFHLCSPSSFPSRGGDISGLVNHFWSNCSTDSTLTLPCFRHAVLVSLLLSGLFILGLSSWGSPDKRPPWRHRPGAVLGFGPVRLCYSASCCWVGVFLALCSPWREILLELHGKKYTLCHAKWSHLTCSLFSHKCQISVDTSISTICWKELTVVTSNRIFTLTELLVILQCVDALYGF